MDISSADSDHMMEWTFPHKRTKITVLEETFLKGILLYGYAVTGYVNSTEETLLNTCIYWGATLVKFNFI